MKLERIMGNLCCFFHVGDRITLLRGPTILRRLDEFGVPLKEDPKNVRWGHFNKDKPAIVEVMDVDYDETSVTIKWEYTGTKVVVEMASLSECCDPITL
jgi:hypothetical protein